MVIRVLHEHLVHLETDSFGYCFLNNLEAKGQNSMHAKITAPSPAISTTVDLRCVGNVVYSWNFSMINIQKHWQFPDNGLIST